MVVQAGKSKVKAEVNESTRVVVETKDLRMARPGDAVVVHGSAYGPGQAEADTIEVTLAENRADEPAVKGRQSGKRTPAPGTTTPRTRCQTSTRCTTSQLRPSYSTTYPVVSA